MNGLDFLERLMRLRPTPVVMVSSHTSRGGETTIRALELGAVDCVAKPDGRPGPSLDDLPGKIRAAAGSARAILRRAAARAAPAPLEDAPAPYRWDGRLVAIGSSTGGVEALMEVLSAYPANGPATVITQHMPETFTASFAERLDRSCAPRVRLAGHDDPIEAGRVYLAPGSTARHLAVVSTPRGLRCRLREQAPVNGHCPSVDVLFASVAKAAAAAAVGVILTGMGRDGADGLSAMREAGAETIGQDEMTSLIYGMPKAAFERGALARQLPLRGIGPHILLTTNARREDR